MYEMCYIRARNKLQLFKDEFRSVVFVFYGMNWLPLQVFTYLGACCLPRLCFGLLLEVKCRSLRRTGLLSYQLDGVRQEFTAECLCGNLLGSCHLQERRGQWVIRTDTNLW